MNTVEQTLPEKIIPIKFVLKYQPPLIGLLYKRNEKDKKKYIYNILLNNLLSLPSPQEIAKQIFIEHSHYINPEYVTFEQVEQLVMRLIETLINMEQEDDDNEEMNDLNEEELMQMYERQKMMENQEDFENENEEEINEEELQELYEQQMKQAIKNKVKQKAADW